MYQASSALSPGGFYWACPRCNYVSGDEPKPTEDQEKAAGLIIDRYTEAPQRVEMMVLRSDQLRLEPGQSVQFRLAGIDYVLTRVFEEIGDHGGIILSGLTEDQKLRLLTAFERMGAYGGGGGGAAPTRGTAGCGANSSVGVMAYAGDAAPPEPPKEEPIDEYSILKQVFG